MALPSVTADVPAPRGLAVPPLATLAMLSVPLLTVTVPVKVWAVAPRRTVPPPLVRASLTIRLLAPAREAAETVSVPPPPPSR